MENQILNVKDLPNLHKLETSPRELSSEYWTPENEGEYKVGVVLDIKPETYEDSTGNQIELPCIIMLAQNEDGSFSTIRNGSKRLVATIENAVERGELIFSQTPVKISYVGKEKNKTNSFKSDRWSVKPLIF